MDNKKMMNAALALLPLVAVVLAGLPNAVTIYPAGGEDVVTCPFLTYITDVPMTICMPFAMILSAACFGMAVLYLVKKKAVRLKTILVSSFGSMTLAVLPIILRSETVIVPNMLVPILMGALCMLAYAEVKKPQEEPKAKPKRLKNTKK